LEDYETSRTNTDYQLAEYDFTGAPSGNARRYYRSTVNSQSFDFYFGTAPNDARVKDNEPGRSEANGLYFDGNDFISQNI
jgi:hypothetical protein